MLIKAISKLVYFLIHSKKENTENMNKDNEKVIKNHVKQNDPLCLKRIQEVGCFFRSCGLLAEYKTGKSLTAPQINATWDWAKATKRIDENDCMKDSASVATRFLRILGDNGRFIEVGLFKDGEMQYYPAFKGSSLARADALIQKVKTNGPEGTHFKVVDKLGKTIEDPHEPAIKGTGVLYSILYAYEG